MCVRSGSIKQMGTDLYRGVAGRRTFVQEVGNGSVMYTITAGNRVEERFCSRAEWDAWCKDHAPIVAEVGVTVESAKHKVAVVGMDVDESGRATFTVDVTTAKTLTLPAPKADALVRRVAREAERESESKLPSPQAT